MENYHFNFEKATKIKDNEELLQKEALEMKNCFEKQGNKKHSLEGSTNYNNALLMEKVFYEQLIPIYNKL